MVDLTLLHPDLVAKIQRVLAAMAALGFPMKPVQGLRTLAQQQALYAQGRTAPGSIVTHDDGVNHLSRHQKGPSGLGEAVDCAFEGPDPFPANDALWAAYGACVTAIGLIWGGSWHTFVDRPHAQLP